MGEFLLELLSEEIPARMQRRAIDDLVKHLDEWLQVHRLRPAEPLRGYVTPRRLAVIGYGIPEQLPVQQEERRGPRVGAPKPAIEGFLRSVGILAIEDCEVRDTGRGEFYFAKIERPGRATAEVLSDLIYSTITEVAWPKSMRFPATSLRWIRPLTSVICLFNGVPVPLPQLGDVPVGNTTHGHRFLSQGEITVDCAADYLGKLAAAHVILDHDRRRDLIAADLDRLAAAEGLKAKPDPALLDEVAGLVEFPVVLMGRIDDASMPLPPEVLATAMRTHQKYFSCLNEDGTAAPRFLFVANNLTPDAGRTIVAGNERVLKARLADARFFWDQDRKVPLEGRMAALKSRIYYDKLGTMFDKAGRMERLAEFLAQQLYPTNRELIRLAQRAAYLAKADLSTGMVGEFPELQGVMGRYYAREDQRIHHAGEDPRVADAIADHYKPQGPGDNCPSAPVGIAVALADKIDTLVGFYGIDEKPTGSRDPFALRRAALGVSRIILENKLRISLNTLLESSYRSYPAKHFSRSPGLVSYEVLTFIVDRLKVHLRERGVRADLIAASVYRERRASDGDALEVVRPHYQGPLVHEDDLFQLLTRVDALSQFLDTDDGLNLLIAYRRASNIVAIEARKGGWSEGDVVPDLLTQIEERLLAERLGDADAHTANALAGEDFSRAMTALAKLRRPVDAFFDKVTVNTDDRALRENRLRLLSRIRAVMNQVADFSQIEG